MYKSDKRLLILDKPSILCLFIIKRVFIDKRNGPSIRGLTALLDYLIAQAMIV